MEYYHENWPDELNPQNCPVYSFNQLKIESSKERIWEQLIDAISWPSWYDNCKNMQFLSQDGGVLQMGTEFSWKTFGVSVTTKITEFKPHHILAWEGRGLGSKGYHVWIIEEFDDGCLVTTEETQRGAIPWLLRWIFRRLLLKYHQKWLEGLAKQVDRE